MKQFMTLLLIIVVSTLSGCAQRLQSISKDVDKTLAENSGYLLIGVDTNWGLHSILIGGDNKLMLTERDLKFGSNYILVDVPAGHYRIEDVKFGRYVYMELEEGYWDFEVRPNQVSYVGDLNIEIQGLWEITSAEIILENRSTKALRFLESSFPNILQSRQVRYSGPGKDNFLEFAEGLSESKEAAL
ncbi:MULTISPECIES: hypothetical protein [unclassified Shewanella]|uniref:hypothetical protein n=1 Tax=unclassified Shewanella TaxID=196818 RepID=UPI00059F254F|nr:MULTISPECIES: hypothetical protein [unclassified Shewanella]KIO36550.1 hypothetical protein DB48_09960 [Shewanella sp. cp20]MCG9721952.1 hypothetical protein [Shewanella sp. Isolate7]MCG9745295.1 hypothetical protein [Shewanella sp. Isolate8]